MFFGRIVSLAMANAAVVGVFTEIPILSDYALWVLVGAYFIWLAVHRLVKDRFKPLVIVSIVLILVAIVGVFVEIPIVSRYVFWIMEANYLMIVAATGSGIIVVTTSTDPGDDFIRSSSPSARARPGGGPGGVLSD